MKKTAFISPDFMLQTKQAQKLYHDFAEDLPIIDYHSHLPPKDIATDRKWENMTRLWLNGDHYKWRAMRSNGVDERFCTGDASDLEKFQKWAETMPYLLRNPMYHWAHLELSRYFGIDDKLLDGKSAKAVWEACNKKLAKPGFTCRGLLEKMNVELVCTTDDPVDTLEYHKYLAADKTCKVKVLPTWRPDKAMAVDNPDNFNRWIRLLSASANMDIRGFAMFMDAIKARHQYFHDAGCRLSDHGLETMYAEDYTLKEVEDIFNKARKGMMPGKIEIAKFKSAMLYEFGVMDFEKKWTQQYHLGVIRNNNTRLFKKIGADSGFDSIGDFSMARPMARFLDRLECAGKLTRTIIYNCNPADNEMIAAMLGNFQDGSVPGKIQMGSGWWFLDQKNGMERQIEALSSQGLLSRFVGMLTDSRSFMSYTRHEYFRRILCNILGDDMEKGLIPNDLKLVGQMVQDISYNNAASYFGFELPKAKR